MALAHNPDQLEITSVEAGGGLSDLNGGDGPDFFAPFETSTGFTLGILFSFSDDFLGLSAEVPVEIALVNYETIADSFAGQEGDSVSTDLAWGNPLLGDSGVPTVENTVVLNGVTGIIPVTRDSSVELIAEVVTD